MRVLASAERQIDGPIGAVVDGMIRRSVHRAFHTVWWKPPAEPLSGPCLFIANHHGWHDGYLAYLAVSKLGMPSVMWVQEYGAFPLFGKVGAMPFDGDNQAVRVQTIRRTVRLLREGRRSLVLFPEGVLHPPPDLLPFGRSLELLRRRVPGIEVVPLAIRYELAMHERPVAHLMFGSPIPESSDPRSGLENLVADLHRTVATKPDEFEVLAAGTADVNERWDLRRRFRP